MPRLPRFCPAGLPVHIIQRGNNRQACFTHDDDMGAYAHFLLRAAHKHAVAVHGWVFMTNHVHLLVTPSTDDATSRLMQDLGRLYVRRFNASYSRSGGLFDGRFKSCVVQTEEYFLRCLCYIEMNPVRSGLVRKPGDYRWSSYGCHAFGDTVEMHSPHPTYLAIGRTEEVRQAHYRSLISTSLSADSVARIRHCTNTGRVLGTETFRQQIKALRG